MSYPQRIYNENYQKLNEWYEDATSLADNMEETQVDLDFISTNDTTQTNISNLISALCYPIFDEYGEDLVAYEDSDVFQRRLMNSIVHKIDKWYIHSVMIRDLLANTSISTFSVTQASSTHTLEDGHSGSIVNQESASTPTGISHNDSDETTLDLTNTGGEITMDTTSGYSNKYTNFMGKTSGLKKNIVDRSVDVDRQGNFIVAMELLKAIPYSYINEVLAEVSQHFIQVY